MRALLLVPLLFALAGCPSTPLTFADSLGSAYAAVDALARTTEELCAAPTIGGDCVGSISTSTRDDVRDQLRLVLDLLDEARSHQVDGSGDLAMQRVGEARAVLAAVSKLLETRA